MCVGVSGKQRERCLGLAFWIAGREGAKWDVPAER